MGIFREIILGMLDAIKEKIFSFIPGLGKKEASAPSRQPAALSSTLYSRNALKGISQSVNLSEPENISLPVGAEEFKKVLKYMTELQKNPFRLGKIQIPPEICAIAQKMASVGKEVANKIGIPPEKLIELSNKFKKKDIGPMALLGSKDILTKLISFYVQSFNMSQEAMALA